MIEKSRCDAGGYSPEISMNAYPYTPFRALLTQLRRNLARSSVRGSREDRGASRHVAVRFKRCGKPMRALCVSSALGSASDRLRLKSLIFETTSVMQ
jgi:hypothetical protein